MNARKIKNRNIKKMKSIEIKEDKQRKKSNQKR